MIDLASVDLQQFLLLTNLSWELMKYHRLSPHPSHSLICANAKRNATNVSKHKTESKMLFTFNGSRSCIQMVFICHFDEQLTAWNRRNRQTRFFFYFSSFTFVRHPNEYNIVWYSLRVCFVFRTFVCRTDKPLNVLMTQLWASLVTKGNVNVSETWIDVFADE